MKLFNHLQFKLLFFLFFGGGCHYAQIPIGYYSFAEGLNGMKLKSALNAIIDGHVQFPYTSTNTDVWDILKERSEEHTSELQSRPHLVCRLLLEKKKKNN